MFAAQLRRRLDRDDPYLLPDVSSAQKILSWPVGLTPASRISMTTDRVGFSSPSHDNRGNRHVCITDPVRVLHSTFVCNSFITGAGDSWTIDPITQISNGETSVTSLAGAIGQAAINAYGIEVRFQSTDFVSTESSVTSSLGSSSSVENSQPPEVSLLEFTRHWPSSAAPSPQVLF